MKARKARTLKKKFVKKNAANAVLTWYLRLDRMVNIWNVLLPIADIDNRLLKTTGVVCPKCGKGQIVERKSKRGTVFYGCNQYPECDYVMWNEPTGETCPDCGALLGKVITKSGTTLKCSNIKCHFKKVVPQEENASTEEL